jgi:hypothetical protein
MTAQVVTITRSAPAGGQGSWAVRTRIKAATERAGKHVGAGDLKPVVGSAYRYRHRCVPGLRVQAWQVRGGPERADRVDARDMDRNPAAVGVPPDVGDVGAHGRVAVRGRLPPLAGYAAGDAPPVSVVADVQDRVGGQQPRGGRGGLGAADHRNCRTWRHGGR